MSVSNPILLLDDQFFSKFGKVIRIISIANAKMSYF